MNTEHRAAWLARGSYGIMVHYLMAPPGDTSEERSAESERIVNGFDLDGFIEQFVSTRADWLIFTIGQNTGYYSGPNAFLDEACPGHTSRRDLVLEIAAGVHGLGKRFIAYLPAEVCAQSEEIHQAFAWNPADQSESQRRYQRFIHAYAGKLGTLLDGWWFDGCHTWDVFHSSLYDWPAWIAAARAGSPNAIITFNDGAFCINNVKPVTPLEDYHAGEVHQLVNGKIKLGHEPDSPLYLPDSQFIDGVQWHALVPVDSTFEGGAPYHYTDQELLGFIKACKSVNGAVTLNLPIGLDGKVPDQSIEQMQRLGREVATGGTQ